MRKMIKKEVNLSVLKLSINVDEGRNITEKKVEKLPQG